MSNGRKPVLRRPTGATLRRHGTIRNLTTRTLRSVVDHITCIYFNLLPGVITIVTKANVHILTMTTPFSKSPSNTNNLNDNNNDQDMVTNPTMIGDMAPTEHNDTVAFASGGNINAVHTRECPTSFRQMRVVSDAHHTIQEMLSRPVLFSDVKCDFGDTFVEFGFLEQWLKDPMVKMLMEPYAMFTGTYCVRAMMNSQPTQAGMALLITSPQRTEVTIESYVTRNVPRADLGAYAKQLVPFFSGLQNVMINLASSSEVVLRVPYVGCRAMNEKSNLIDTSFIYHNISALRTNTGTAKLPVQFYGWMEDLELYGTSTGDATVKSYVGVSAADVKLSTFDGLFTKGLLNAFSEEQAVPGGVILIRNRDKKEGGALRSEYLAATVMEAASWLQTYILQSFYEKPGGVLLVTGTKENLKALRDLLPEKPSRRLNKTQTEVATHFKVTAASGPDYIARGVGGGAMDSIGALLLALLTTVSSFEVSNKARYDAVLALFRPTGTFQSGKPPATRPGREKIPRENLAAEEHAVGKEAEDEGIKISTVASAIGKVAGFAAKIPMLADFAIPVEWAANGVANTARFFGFSKPHVVEAEKPVVQKPFYHFVHGAGASTATKLSLNPDQAVQTVSLGPEQSDEMALSYLTSRPGLYFNMSWATTNARGDCLFQDPMLPSRFYIAQQYSIVNVAQKAMVKFNTHLSYLAEMFMYYVGGFLFTLTLGATKFHSGRLRFVFVPQMPLPTQANDAWTKDQLATVYNQQNKNYHMVMDIRDAMTFTFKTPYEPGQPVIPNEINMCNTVPAMFVFVEVPLVASAGVSSTIDGWFSVSGAPGFKFVGPRMSSKTKLLPFAKGILSAPGVEGKETWTPGGVRPRGTFQGFDNSSYTRTETSSLAPAVVDMSGKLNETAAALTAQTMTVGDVVESLRMLIKRPSEALYFVNNATTWTYNMWIPWFNTTQTGEQFESETFFQRIRSLYRFSTGGIILSGFNNTEKIYTKKFKLTDLTDLSYFKQRFAVAGHGANGYAWLNAKKDEYFSEVPFVCETMHRQSLEGAWSFEIPYYNQYDKTDNMLVWARGTSSTMDYVSQFSPPVALMWRGEPQSVQSLYIAAAEDFNCGYLNGPPITFIRPLSA